MEKTTELVTPLNNIDTKKLPYMVQLDALRALAVFGVMIAHFFPESLSFNAILQPGSFGVRLFFVLSGFLITGILLKCKDNIATTNQDLCLTLKIFYIRRCLRIFPTYYLALIIAITLNLGEIRRTFFWHFSYTSNFYFQIKGSWDIATAHFWTLSVEEQFYLIWPFIILLTAKRHLKKIFLAAIVIGPLFRLCYLIIAPDKAYTIGNLLTLAFLDSFSLGAILAYFTHEEKRFKETKKLFISLCFWIGFPLFIVLLLMNLLHSFQIFEGIFSTTIISLFCTWLIARASKGFSGIAGKVLEQDVLVYLGKISYGIYVYHLFMPLIMRRVFNYFGGQYPNSLLIQFTLNVMATLIIAIVSYHLFENPINRLKKNFEYISVL